MTVEQFLERLDHARPTGPGTWQAACPHHDDRVASLSIGVGHDGRILVRCHAGCAAADVVAAVGMSLADLFDRPPAAPPSPAGFLRVPGPAERRPPVVPRARVPEPSVDEGDIVRWRRRLVASPDVLAAARSVKGWSGATMVRLELGFDGRRIVFPVRAADGRLVGALRYTRRGDPKMRADRGTPRELWPPPERLPESAPVFLVEGEPDAVSAAQLGLTAVAVPGAASWKESWSGRLAGRTVVVIGDCDKPGRAMAARARGLLAGVCDVRVVELGSARDDGHDLGDEVTRASGEGEVALFALRCKLSALAGLDVVQIASMVPAKTDA